jgi:hypothetical protein
MYSTYLSTSLNHSVFTHMYFIYTVLRIEVQVEVYVKLYLILKSGTVYMRVTELGISVGWGNGCYTYSKSGSCFQNTYAADKYRRNLTKFVC